MPGSAVLGINLVDRLQPLADRMRQLEDRFGLRQFDVYRVHRRWTGVERGDGNVVVLLDNLLDPRPLVSAPNNQGAPHYELAPGSKLDEGEILLEQVSLTYTEAELTGPAPMPPLEEWFFRLVDARGQDIPTRYYVLNGPPRADRLKTMGWVLQLQRARIAE